MESGKNITFFVTWKEVESLSNHNVDFTILKDLIQQEEELFIRSLPKTKTKDNPWHWIVEFICSGTPVLARILGLDDDGVLIKPTPEYRYTLEDLFLQHRLIATPVLKYSSSSSDEKKYIAIGVCLKMILKDGTTLPL